MDVDQLFLDTLDDLARRAKPPVAEYDVLMAAPLLRKLLLDRRRLVDEVRRTRGGEVTFRINGRDPIWKIAGSPPPAIWSIQDGLDPDTALARVEPVEVTLDQLLAKVVLVHGGHEETVKDLIRHAAHVAGGVHIGTPESEKERLLNELGQRLQLGGYSSAIRPLMAIARVVVQGLTPLREAIEKERTGS